MSADRGDAFRGLHVLADDDPRWGRDPVQIARDACQAGAPVIQLRTKHATDSQTLQWAQAIREITREAGARFVVNDRFDIALLAEADAVHLGQDDLPPDALPQSAREKLAIGRSTHTPEQLEAARNEAVDYVAFGPVFGTASKDSSYSERGLEALRQAVALAAPRPLIAIGGIKAHHLAELRAAGAGGFAVISVIAGARDLVAATSELIEGFREIGK